jgi:hypothetical protein
MESFGPPQEQPGDPIPQPPVSTLSADSRASTHVSAPDGAAGAKQPRRHIRPTDALALGLIVLLVAAGLYLVTHGPRKSHPSPAVKASLRLALTNDQTLRYRFHMVVESSARVGGGAVVSNEDLLGTSSWHVDSVDSRGVAAVTVTMSDVSHTVNGKTYPQPTQTLHLQIASDGRVLAEAGFGTTSGRTDAGPGFPGMDQLLPLLPGRPVAVGDIWRRSFDQTNPLGTGSIHYATTSTFARFEEVNRIKAAVIHTTAVLPIEASMNIREALAATGQPSIGLPEAANPVDSYLGLMNFRQTSWIDPSRDSLLKSTTFGQFAVLLTRTGGQRPSGGQLDYKGTIIIYLRPL